MSGDDWRAVGSGRLPSLKQKVYQMNIHPKGTYEIDGMDYEIQGKGSPYQRFNYLTAKALKREDNSNPSETIRGPQEAAQEPQEAEAGFRVSQRHIERQRLDSIRDDVHFLNADLKRNGHNVEYVIERRVTK